MSDIEMMMVPFSIAIMMLLGIFLVNIQLEDKCSDDYIYSKFCYVCDETNTTCLKGEVENNKCKTGFLFDVKFHNEYKQDKWLSVNDTSCKWIEGGD